MELKKAKKDKLHIHEYDREYFPCAKEWWCTEGYFTTNKNNKKWSFKATLYQAISKTKEIWSVYGITIFDLDTNKSYFYISENDSKKLESKKDSFYINYEGTFKEGSYPNYHMHLLDKKNNIKLDFKFKAESLPFWVGQSATGGWLPWGFGYYRYGFIPKGEIEGTIEINNEKISMNGQGYNEHVWGDFSFFYVSSKKGSLSRTISTYSKLIAWWLHNKDIKFPKSIGFSTDNRAPGYDWTWAIFDNGWSLFYGNMMLYIMEGPGTGVLILSKDGKKYIEFGDITFKYRRMKYLKKFDFYYPIDLELTAIEDQEKIYLRFITITESMEEFVDAEGEKDLFGLLVSQVPCKVEGYYFDGNKKTFIKGISKLESHRLLKKIGHNSLKFNFDVSKNRFGLLTSFDSHYLGKKLDINLNLLPKPSLRIDFDRIDKSQLK